ncbi:DUF2938 domain-containing protein [Sphingomonas sp. Root241]|uniref:DUF2938 domain-containing protein n=1 Tax=Sphingomonas sp. Root241 TaxID=1736501 RepID=UPI0007002F41|nr:DUF2938 domain-containing protein [Sphingomonas sp. Root241]KRC82747.1 hypothetical protein ASE13_03495 [Sphingomonas sp. Root241]
MHEFGKYLLYAAAIGIGATAVMDLWGVFLKRLLGIQPLDFGLVGRWIGYWPRGQFRHDSIAAAEMIRGERLIGWTAHYLTGIVFAGILLVIWGSEWVRNPTLGPALMVGIGSVAAPFVLLQPAMGMGVASSKSPRPGVARVRSLITHTVFGLGLYFSGLVLEPWAP